MKSPYLQPTTYHLLFSPVLPDVLLRLAIDGPAPDRLPLVPQGLALGQGDLALDQIVLHIQPQGNQRQSLFLRAARQLVNLPPMEEQAAVPEGIMIQIASRTVRADVAVDQPDLTALHRGVPILQVGLAVANRLHPGPGQL